MTLGIVLIVLGFIIFCGGAFLFMELDDLVMVYVAMVVGLVVIIFGAFRIGKAETDECHKRGGKIVETGNLIPIVISSGKYTTITYVPETKCEVAK